MTFRTILQRLLLQTETPVRLAIFCDEEGERVAAVRGDPALSLFDIDLVGASYASVALLCGADGSGPSDLSDLRVRIVYPDRITWLWGVASGYYLVVESSSDGRANKIQPLLDDICVALRAEM